MQTRILHIIDDHKFIEYVKATYEINGYLNTYEKFINLNLANLKSNFDIIVIHFLRPEYHLLFTDSYFEIRKIFWTLWGADAFSLGCFFNSHLMPFTIKSRIKNSFKKNFIFGLKIWLKYLMPKIFDYQPINLKTIGSISRIKNIITLMPGDYLELISSYESDSNYFHINYLDPTLLYLGKHSFNNGNNILLGNSAEYTNNHIDILKMLTNTQLDNRVLLTPLSYGDTFNANYIENYGLDKFNNSFKALRNFMSLETYSDLINSCEIAIMPHIRQQALGNIVKLLYGGCNIYFNEKSNIYKFLYFKGFYISSLKDLSNLITLDIKQKQKNRTLVIEYFGKDTIHKKITEMINSIS
jgi:dTDP-N-acetylfucosamine:lipid II N-acetylfucosaminyltransferase